MEVATDSLARITRRPAGHLVRDAFAVDLLSIKRGCAKGSARIKGILCGVFYHKCQAIIVYQKKHRCCTVLKYFANLMRYRGYTFLQLSDYVTQSVHF